MDKCSVYLRIQRPRQRRFTRTVSHQQIDTDGDLNSITATSDIKKIGVSGYGNGAQLNATVDDFRIYDGAMTAKQVKALYDGKDVQSVQPVAVSTSISKAPALPDTVSVIYKIWVWVQR